MSSLVEQDFWEHLESRCEGKLCLRANMNDLVGRLDQHHVAGSRSELFLVDPDPNFTMEYLKVPLRGTGTPTLRYKTQSSTIHIYEVQLHLWDTCTSTRYSKPTVRGSKRHRGTATSMRYSVNSYKVQLHLPGTTTPLHLEVYLKLLGTSTPTKYTYN